jgi:hypothetical protein
MPKARPIITAVMLEGRTRADVARDYQVPKGYVSKLVAHYLAEGDTAFQLRSRRPKSNPNQTPAPAIEVRLW